MSNKLRWADYIVMALKELGGSATYSELYEKIREIRHLPYTKEWKASVRRTIEDHSSDSNNFRGADLFYSVGGIGSGVWGLRNFNSRTPVSYDLDLSDEHKELPRILQNTYRILRDTQLAREVKKLYGHRCQICNFTFLLRDGTKYAEAHHIKPLGKPHNGPDSMDNILCLCPNHHAMLDYGSIQISLDNLQSHKNHHINEAYISYQNKTIYHHKFTNP